MRSLSTAFGQIEEMAREAENFETVHPRILEKLEKIIQDWTVAGEIEKALMAFAEHENSRRAFASSAGIEEGAVKTVVVGEVEDMVELLHESTGRGTDLSSLYQNMSVKVGVCISSGSDRMVGAIETSVSQNRITPGEVRMIVDMARLGMQTTLAPVLAKTLQPENTMSTRHTVQELDGVMTALRHHMERQTTVSQLIEAVLTRCNSAEMVFQMQDEDLAFSVSLHLRLLADTTEQLETSLQMGQRLETMQRDGEPEEAVDRCYTGILHVFGTIMQDLRLMQCCVSRRGVASVEETVQRLRSLRSDPVLYKAWVDDMCGEADPLPCNDTRTP